MLTEACVLSVPGAAVGYAIALLAWQALPSIAPADVPRLASARPDGVVLVFSIAVSVVSGALFGMLPSLRTAFAVQPAIARDLNVRNRASVCDRARSVLIAGEIAITVSLVLGGGAVMNRFLKLLRTDPGFDARHVIACVVLPARDRYPAPEARANVYRRFMEAVRSIPGVESAGVVDALPFRGENHGGYLEANGQRIIAEIDNVGGDYLQSLGVRLIAGRWLNHNAAPADNQLLSSSSAEALRSGSGPKAMQSGNSSAWAVRRRLEAAGNA